MNPAAEEWLRRLQNYFDKKQFTNPYYKPGEEAIAVATKLKEIKYATGPSKNLTLYN
jgi:hypothetical protein